MPERKLQFFNGIAGFSEDGREYVIQLGKGRHTPAPWVNVISNKNFGFIVTEVFSHQIMSLFNRDKELIEIGTHGIRIFLLMLPIVGIQIIITNYFQSVGKASKAILLSLTRQVLFLIPLVLILPTFLGLDGIWTAGPVSDFSSALLAIILLNKEFRYLQTKHEQAQPPAKPL
jgi:Na+-driven multidrug efflux pump